MRFHLDAGAHVVAARDGFPSTKDAELWVIRGDHPINQRADPYQRIVYRDPHPLDDLPALFDNGNGMRIMLQSHGLKGAADSNDPLVAPANTYDTVTNEVAGVAVLRVQQVRHRDRASSWSWQPASIRRRTSPPAAADPDAEFATSDYNVENLYDFRDDPFDGCDFVGNPGCPGVNPPFDFVPASEAAYQKHLVDLARADRRPDACAGPADDPGGRGPGHLRRRRPARMLCGSHEQPRRQAGHAAGAGAGHQRGRWPDLPARCTTATEPMTAASSPPSCIRTDTVELLPADADDPVLGSSPTVDYRGTPLAYNAQVSNPKVLNADLPADVDLSTGVDGGNVFTRPPQVGHFRVWRDGIGLSVFTDLYAHQQPLQQHAERAGRAADRTGCLQRGDRGGAGRGGCRSGDQLLATSTSSRGRTIRSRPGQPYG